MKRRTFLRLVGLGGLAAATVPALPELGGAIITKTRAVGQSVAMPTLSRITAMAEWSNHLIIGCEDGTLWKMSRDGRVDPIGFAA